MHAYLTHDEVNAAMARRLVRRLGSKLTVLQVKTADRAVGVDGLIIVDIPPEADEELGEFGHLVVPLGRTMGFKANGAVSNTNSEEVTGPD